MFHGKVSPGLSELISTQPMDTCKIDIIIILFWFKKVWVFQGIPYAQEHMSIINNQK